MCNLFANISNAASIREWTNTTRDISGNWDALRGIFPDFQAPIVRNSPDGRELALARWGMPSPAIALRGKKADPGVTNIRNTKSRHWTRWLDVGHRAVVPFTSFSEYETLQDGSHAPVWFALSPERPLAFFAGIRVAYWALTRKVKEGPVTTDLFGFLTTDASEPVRSFHPKAMPVILTTPDEVMSWMEAPVSEALGLQRPLPPDMLGIVARGTKKDPPE